MNLEKLTRKTNLDQGKWENSHSTKLSVAGNLSVPTNKDSHITNTYSLKMFKVRGVNPISPGGGADLPQLSLIEEKNVFFRQLYLRS